MVVFQDKTYAQGTPISSDDLSQMVANDQSNYNSLWEQPQGIIYWKKGFNTYNNTKDIIATDTSSAHDATGSKTLAPIKLQTAYVTVQPSRRYYIEFQSGLVNSTNVDNIPKYRISVNGSPKVAHVRHLPFSSGASAGNGRYTSCRSWLIYDTADISNFSTNIMRVDIFIQQAFTSSSGILKLFAQNGTGTENFWLKVEDWGTTIPTETLL